jgi:hypothetical protein
MLPKTRFIFLALFCLFLSSDITAENTPNVLSANTPNLHFSFDDCVSFAGASSEDYSEFTPVVSNFPECSTIETAFPNHVFRGQQFPHSCTPGIGNTLGMCIEGSNNCFYDPGNNASLRLNVRVAPGQSGIGSLDRINFFEKAPIEFDNAGGLSGPNNYPTQLGIRVLKNNNEIFRTIIQTSREWTFVEVDFNDLAAFTVTEITEFEIELLPFCPVGNASTRQVWDIDELNIVGGCNNISGGNISTNDNTDICASVPGSGNIEFNVNQVFGGSSTSWIVTAQDGTLLLVQDSNMINFSGLPGGTYNVNHINIDIPLTGLNVGNNISDLVGCFDLSNTIVVNNTVLTGGTLTDTNGFSDSFLCVDNSPDNIILTQLTGAQGSIVNYILTDSNDQIVESLQGPNIDFNGLPEGTFFLYAVSHEGQFLNGTPGFSLNDLAGCFELSTPFRVVRNIIDIGMISFNGQTEVQLCGAEGMSFTPTVTGPAASNGQFIVSSLDGQILDIIATSSINIIDFTLSQIQIRLISLSGRVDGLEINGNINNLDGCFLLSNPITITNEDIEGGNISTNGMSDISICLNDATISAFTVDLVGAVGDNATFVVTNAAGIITDITADNVFDFTNDGVGVSLVYNLSFMNGLTGLEIGNDLNIDLQGCFELSNAITVTRDQVDAGTIATSLGDTAVDVCSGDGISDEIVVAIQGNASPESTLFVTDSAGLIITTIENSTFDFEGVDSGVCFIYHVASLEVLTFNIGQDIDSLSGCIDRSNAITVTRSEVSGGNLIASDGSDCVNIITGDAVIDLVDVVLTDAIGSNLQWVITDTAGEIVLLPDSAPFAFEGLGDTLLIRNLSFSDLISGLAIGSNISDIAGCFSLSNTVKVTQQFLTAGTITTNTGQDTLSVCLGDGVDDLIDVNLSGNQGPEFSFIITNEAREIIALPAAPPFNVTNAGGGICFIYHIAFLPGLTGLNVGDNVSDLAGSFSLSNRITLDRSEVNGGELTATDGTDCVNIITGDAVIDSIDVNLNNSIGNNMAWVVTDVDDNIVLLPMAPPFALEGLGDSLFIRNISFADNLLGLTVGSNLSNIEGCFSISNAVKVTQQVINGGTIVASNGQNSISVCLGDGVDDLIDVTLTGNVGPEFSFIITDDSGDILALPSAPPFDVTNAGNGTCFIYHIAFIGGLNGLSVGENISDLSGSFSLSNRITLNRSEVDGGVISANVNNVGVGTEFTICSGDNMPDILNLMVEDTLGLLSQWIVADTANTILTISNDAPEDFEGVPAGMCLIYHIASLPGLTGSGVGDNVFNIEGCFDLSNVITITKNEVDGGVLALADGSTIDTIIVGDQVADIADFTLIDNVGDTSLFLITDTLGVITLLPSGPIDLNTLAPGVCELYNLSYVEDITGLAIGNNIDMIDGCFDLSNPITYIKSTISGGTIATLQGDVVANFCLSDMNSDTLFTMLNGEAASNFSWIVTDDNDTIVSLLSGPNIDFTGTGAGVSLVYHIGFEDNLVGLTIGNNINDLAGTFDLSNVITVTRDEIISGTLLTTNNEVELTIMVDDGIPDSIDVVAPAVMGADTSIWLITDTLGVITTLPDTFPVDFENLGSGTCQIWYLSFIDPLQGVAIGNNVSDLVGCSALSTPVTVTRMGLMGGNLMTSDSLTSLSICAGDGIADPFDVILTDTVGTQFSWLIADSLGVILDLPSGPPFDLEGLGEGSCNLFNISAGANLSGLTVGENINALTGNFNLSNPITVFRSLSVGGMITTSTGDTTATVIVGDNFPDLIGVSVSGASGINMTWLVTDTLGNIIELPSGPPFTFEDSDPGVCQIWNLSHGNGTTGIAIGNNLTDIVGCIALSNPISVTKEAFVLESGVITFANGDTETTICTGDGVVEPLDITLTGNIGPNFRYIITDTTGLIQGLPPGGGGDINLDLEQSGGGIARIYHLAHSNGLTGLAVGNNLTDLNGIIDLSDFITVNRNEVDGGIIALPNGTTAVTIMTGDGMSDLIDVSLTDTEGDTSLWIITDANDLIIALPDTLPFDFELTGTGICNLYNLSSIGTTTGISVGNSISDIMGCFDLSNPVVVTRIGIAGGILTLADGGTSTSVCFNGMTIDSIDVILEQSNGAMQSFVITDDQGVIVDLPSSSPFDLSTFGLGTCLIYNIAFDPNLVGLEIDSSINNLMGMFDLSNPVTVSRAEADGGSIMIDNGMLTDTIVVNDQMPDTIDVVLTGPIAGDINQFIITDEVGTITAIQDSTRFIFETQGGGTCSIWSISYDDALAGLTVGNNVSNLEGCFDLSNAITIVREGINGGILTTSDSLTFLSVCTGDNIDDFIDFILVDTTGTNHSFILTSGNQILSPNIFPPFNFESIAGGIEQFQIYNIAFEDGLTGLNFGGSLSGLTGTFDLSNPINFDRDVIELNGALFGNSSQSIQIIVGAGVNDTVQMTLPPTIVGDTVSWILVDNSDEIIELLGEPPFLFEDSDLDTCNIHLVTHAFGINGLEVGSNLSDLEGCFAVSNGVEVIKKRLLGGTLTTMAGDTTAQFCVGDGVADNIQLSLIDTLGDNQNYVLTDSLGTIILITDNNDINFEGTGAGVCSLFSIVFNGILNDFSIGEPLSDVSGCFLLSNPIVVNRISVVGGSINLLNGGDAITLCNNDGIDTTLTFVTTSNAMPYTYVITDENNVIDTILTTDSFTFSDSLSGVCRVWGISFTGSFTAMPGDTLFIDTLSSECADISGNAITVTKEACPGMPIINEISSAGLIEILNIGVDSINLAGYQLCNNGNYQELVAADVNCGELFLAPGEFVVIDYNAITLDPSDGEMALYIDANFGSNQSIVDYVQWGATSHLRTNIAIGAGIWTAGDAVAPFAASSSLLYDGDGDASTDWSQGTTSPCSSNLNDPNSSTEFSYKLYPVPAKDMITVELSEQSDDAVHIEIYDGQSRAVMSSIYKNTKQTNVMVDQMQAGIYYMRVTVGNRTSVKKFLIIE